MFYKTAISKSKLLVLVRKVPHINEMLLTSKGEWNERSHIDDSEVAGR